MNILLLSCNTGQGHNSAATAIKEYFECRDVHCQIKDALAYWSEKNSKIISKGHIFFYRNLPHLFGVGYKYEENHPAKSDDTSLMFDIVTKGCKDLLCDLKSSNYNAVICTHVFSAMMMTKIRHISGYTIPTYFISTDYTCHPGCSETDLDGYFIPHADLIDEFIAAGIEKNKIHPSGIPVSQIFYKKNSPQYAKGMLRLPVNKKIVLIMCGSMGCGPIRQLAETLQESIPEDSHLVAVCGNNRRLYQSLIRKRLNNVTVVGYTSRMPVYMDAADVMLTKPGGLSSTEAAAKNLPMIFIDAVPGCESKNLEFFISRNLADTAQGAKALSKLTNEYLEGEQKNQSLRNRLKENFSTCSAEIVFEYVMR